MSKRKTSRNTWLAVYDPYTAYKNRKYAYTKYTQKRVKQQQVKDQVVFPERR